MAINVDWWYWILSRFAIGDIDANDASCSRLEFNQLLRRLTQLKCYAPLTYCLCYIVVVFVYQRLMRRGSWLLLMLSLLQQPHEVDSLLADIIGLNALCLVIRDMHPFADILSSM